VLYVFKRQKVYFKGFLLISLLFLTKQELFAQVYSLELTEEPKNHHRGHLVVKVEPNYISINATRLEIFFDPKKNHPRRRY
jgi:hypothetical protein